MQATTPCPLQGLERVFPTASKAHSWRDILHEEASRRMVVPIGLPIMLRQYQPRDLEAMVRMDRLCFAQSFRFSRSEMRRFAEGTNAATLVAEAGADLAGFIIVQAPETTSADSYVITLDVAEPFTRLGLGTRLLQEGEAAAVRVGSLIMTLHVHVRNSVAIAFYERNGYRRISLLREFYGDVPGGGDAFFCQKNIRL